jgi:hypothetical protein
MREFVLGRAAETRNLSSAIVDASSALPEFPAHQAEVCLVLLNSGLHSESQALRLDWRWEVQVPELKSSMFVIPATAARMRRITSVYSTWSRARSLSTAAASITARYSPFARRICLGRRKINLSQVFAGQNVGVKE